ncbi:YciI family protein [Kitasatospora sp. HPMI-4]|uniref:YciI family protein n=1 Tax=Kitasatospora sp. HPMI-4 TaxID=3448443 RepID=UPI003F1A9BFA
MFILTLTYLGSLEEIDALLPAHREYLERHYREGRFLLSGRQVPRTGGFILALGDGLEELREITRTDPFADSGLARYEIIQIAPTTASTLILDGLAAAGIHDIASVQPAR